MIRFLIFLLLFSLPAYAVNLSPYILSEWKCDDNGDSGVADTFGSTNGVFTDNVTGAGPTTNATVPGVIDSALEFDTDEYVTTANFQTTFRSPFSISFWFKADDGQPAATEGFCGVLNALGTMRMMVFLTDDGKITCRYAATGGNLQLKTGVLLEDGQETWHHFVCTTEAEKGGVKIYFDGKLIIVGDADTIDMTSWTHTENFIFGGYMNNATPTAFYNGDIDNFIIHTQVLTAKEVAYLYNRGIGSSRLSTNDINKVRKILR